MHNHSIEINPSQTALKDVIFHTTGRVDSVWNIVGQAFDAMQNFAILETTCYRSVPVTSGLLNCLPFKIKANILNKNLYSS